MPHLKIGIELAGLGLPPKEALKSAADLGADAVELDARGQFAPKSLAETGLRQLRKMLADLHLRVAAVSFRTRRGYDSPADLEARVEATKAAMRLAARLGAAAVVNHVGRVPSDPNPSTAGLLLEVLADLAHYGNHVGAFLAAETGSEPGTQLARLMDCLPEGTIGVDFNPGNLAAAGHSPTEAVAALGPRILHVHATDGFCNLATQRGEITPLGSGATDFPSLLAMLDEHGYQGHFTISPHGPDPQASAALAIDYLRKL
ncbi:MAG: sugar phosphate isomerase/epimerase [Planctomycetaceae bacterium]|nr:sugar phosphate isomerase/epimerase [Planctomycetaceae bacterium]